MIISEHDAAFVNAVASVRVRLQFAGDTDIIAAKRLLYGAFVNEVRKR